MHQPDFILIGAMKCGTSTLAAQLGAQRGVFMTTPKEPNYFSDDPVFAQGEGWYRGLFADAPAGTLKGEASTHYTKLPTYPDTVARMQAMLPDLRLVYMIRNPETRAVSHYLHEWTEGRLGGDANAAFADCPEIVTYGCYGLQIAPFIEAYGTERVLLTSLEQIQADAETEFTRIAAHLGIEDASWVHDLPAQNVSAERIRKLPLHGLLVANPVATALRRALVPQALRDRVKQSRSRQDRPDIPEALKTQMRAQFLEDRQSLVQYFPAHPALGFCYPFAGGSSGLDATPGPVQIVPDHP